MSEPCSATKKGLIEYIREYAPQPKQESTDEATLFIKRTVSVLERYKERPNLFWRGECVMRNGELLDTEHAREFLRHTERVWEDIINHA